MSTETKKPIKLIVIGLIVVAVIAGLSFGASTKIR